MANPTDENETELNQKIAKILDESRTSSATHIRKLKDLAALRSKISPSRFAPAFFKTLTPLFSTHRRIASIERVVRFVSAFACCCPRDPNSDAFLEAFLRFLLVAARAANKAPRFRACQIISEVIMRLPDDAEVGGDLWDEVIECMMCRVGDRVARIRTFAVRGLSRFVGESDNSDVLDLFLEMLPVEQNAEVRKAIVLSLPPSNATSQTIINRTLDVSESVRKAAYCVLASKFPLQSLSIKLRTVIINRGLADRSASVKEECLKLLKDEWLVKCCKGDPIELLKYLDVETYELVGESVMEALLKANLLKLNDYGSIQHYVQLENSNTEATTGDTGNCASDIRLMEAEVSLFWRTVCRHVQEEACAKGSDAATTMGTEAAVYAAEASDSNDLLEKILPATVVDYINIVKAHIDGGPNHRFAARQLLLLGSMLDFSDSTNRKVAGVFVQELLSRPLEHEADDDGNKVIIGDGMNLGGERDWARAVSGLAMKVHAASGEFEEVMLKVIEDLAQPCRERTAYFMQWMHCLAVTGLLLENVKSLRWLQGKAMEPNGLLQSLLLPGAKHVSLDVQRVAIRCLGLYGLLEMKPSREVVKQLRISFVKSPAPVKVVACKALIDLAMWHGPQEVDRALGLELSSQLPDDNMAFNPMNFFDEDSDINIELLDILYAAMDKNDWSDSLDTDENESIQGILGEGFAKILLLSDKYSGISASVHPLILGKLISMYFSKRANDLQRLKQCLSVFFEHYPSLSADHKKYISKAFIPVMRQMWPGINGQAGTSSVYVSDMRKRAVQASRFMLTMMQVPIYMNDRKNNDSDATEHAQATDGSPAPCFEFGLEGLALRIATEVSGFHAKKTSAEKSYVSALCKVLALCRFNLSEQGAIKLMRRLLIIVAQSVSSEKDLLKELKQMSEHLQAVDKSPDEELLQGEANNIYERLELDLDLNVKEPISMPQTPAPRSTRPARSRRRVRHEESSSDEDTSPTSIQAVPSTLRTRVERASKTVALTKITTGTRSLKIDEDDQEGEGSEVSSAASNESEGSE